MVSALSKFGFGLLACSLITANSHAAPPRFETQEIDKHIGNICYAVTVADVNGDKKPDVVAVSEDAVVWYENPTWAKHDITRGKTARDNVCIQPHDIDGDGRIDFALGAGWKPPDAKTPSTLQWLGRDKAGAWQIHPIRFEEPMLHRLRWGDVKGTGKKQLIVAPLQGRGTKGPDWGKGQGVKLQVFEVPKDPTSPDWPVEIADSSLHTIHNLQAVDLPGVPAMILAAAWEGVFSFMRDPAGDWLRSKLGSGNQDTKPFKGASEVKMGLLLNDGSNVGSYVATIEPWHGHQVVVYSEPKLKDAKEFTRQVIAEPVQWGHAVWTANLDDDPDDELIIGQRDPNKEGTAGPRGPGVFLFDPKLDGDKLTFDRYTIDDGGMGCEDALAADLDGDGRLDVIAGGRSTHNVRIYWNKKR